MSRVLTADFRQVVWPLEVGANDFEIRMVSESHKLTPEERRELVSCTIPYTQDSGFSRGPLFKYPLAVRPAFFLPLLLVSRIHTHRID